MKRYIIGTLFFCLASTSFAMGNSQDQDKSLSSNPGAAQARQDYRVLMQELKKMGEQYNQVTGEIKQVIKEEGVPVWNEESGEFEIRRDLDLSHASVARFEDAGQELRAIFLLPGVKKNTLKVTVEGSSILNVEGVRTIGQEQTSVQRSVSLPVPVDSKAPRAVYENGVLTVTLKKLETPNKIVPVPVQ